MPRKLKDIRRTLDRWLGEEVSVFVKPGCAFVGSVVESAWKFGRVILRVAPAAGEGTAWFNASKCVRVDHARHLEIQSGQAAIDDPPPCTRPIQGADGRGRD